MPSPTPLPKTWASLSDLPEYLGVHRATIARKKKKGDIPCFKFGGRWLVDLVALDRKIRKGEM